MPVFCAKQFRGMEYRRNSSISLIHFSQVLLMDWESHRPNSSRSSHNRWSKNFGVIIAGKHHPSTSNNSVMLDSSWRLVNLPTTQLVATIGLNVSVTVFHSNPNTLVKASGYWIKCDDSSSRYCSGMLRATAASLAFHFLCINPPKLGE